MHCIEYPDRDHFDEGLLARNMHRFEIIAAAAEGRPVAEPEPARHEGLEIERQKATHEAHEVCQVIVGQQSVTRIGQDRVAGKQNAFSGEPGRQVAAAMGWSRVQQFEDQTVQLQAMTPSLESPGREQLSVGFAQVNHLRTDLVRNDLRIRRQVGSEAGMIEVVMRVDDRRDRFAGDRRFDRPPVSARPTRRAERIEGDHATVASQEQAADLAIADRPDPVTQLFGLQRRLFGEVGLEPVTRENAAMLTHGRIQNGVGSTWQLPSMPQPPVRKCCI